MARLDKTLYDDDFLVFCPLSLGDEYVDDKCDNLSKGKCLYFKSKVRVDDSKMDFDCGHADFNNCNY